MRSGRSILLAPATVALGIPAVGQIYALLFLSPQP